MKIAILYICTGKYSVYWQDFYQSAAANFLPCDEKFYFIFSDMLSGGQLGEDARLIYQQKMGWPKDTLMRFHLFEKIAPDLSSFDYIFFCNANTVFKQPVTFDRFMIGDQHPDLIVVKHPFFHWVKDSKDFPYERNPASTAFMKKRQGQHYVMGGFNGGKMESYLRLITALKENIDKDLSKSVLARWHDESHLNKYISATQAKVKYLEHHFGFPEGHELPLSENIFIEFSDKAKNGGHDFLRGQENSIPVSPAKHTGFLARIKNKIRSAGR